MIFRKNKKSSLGFTLLELLVGIGVLVLLLSVVLIAINPFEQFNRASDVATQAVAKDFVSSTQYYFTSTQSLPWQKDVSCRNELASKKTLADMPSCMKDLTDGGQLQASALSANESKNVHITECSDAVAVCYKPKSQQFHKNQEVKYTHNGVIQPGCSNGSSKDCYVCTFTTSDAQECFQALNPNGTLAMGTTPAPGQPIPISSRHYKDTCSDLNSGQFACMAQEVTNASGTTLSSLGVAGGLTPIHLHTAYNLPCAPGGSIQSPCETPATFGPQTIAIVDAYHAPNLESDLAVYNQVFGLPACTIANGCLRVVNQNGQTSPMPSVDINWALETTLDVQMAHAVCQTCKILVIEANAPTYLDMGIAAKRAGLMSANAISNSYGANEWSEQTAFDTYYDHPGVFVTAASGDSGFTTSYPATSKNVIGVGGTTLSLFADNTYASESVWQGAGSGCSKYALASSFQTSLPNWYLVGCNTNKASADVSAVADPNSGVAVYYSYTDRSGWYILGGTSVSSPIVAAALTMLGNPPADGPAASFIYTNRDKFRDVTTGNNGNCGTPICTGSTGYDGPSGVGSPDFALKPTPTGPPTPTPTIVSNPPWHAAAFFAGKVAGNNPPSMVAIPQYMVAPYTSAMDLKNNYVTVDAWVKPDLPTTTIGGYPYTIVNNIYTLQMDPRLDGDNVSYQYFFGIMRKTSLDCQPTGVYSSGSILNNNKFITVPKSQFTTWKHVVGVFQDNSLHIYENGVLLNSYFSPNGSMNVCNQGREMRVGAGGQGTLILGEKENPVLDNTVVSNYFQGAIDEVRVSDNVRYTSNFTPQTAPFTPDDHTMMLYHFDNNARDASKNALHGHYLGDVHYVRSDISTTPTCSASPNIQISFNSGTTVYPGGSLAHTMTVTSTDPAACSTTYTLTSTFPTGWSAAGIPSDFTLSGGASKALPLTIQIPTNTIAGNYTYKIFVTKQGQSTQFHGTGNVQVLQTTTSTPTPTPTPSPTPSSTPTPTITPTPSPTPNGQPIVCGTAGNFPSDMPTHAGEMKAFLWKDEGAFAICKPPQFGPYTLDVSFDPNFTPPVYDAIHTWEQSMYDGNRGGCCQTFHGMAYPQNNTWGYMYQHFGDLVTSLIIRPNNGGYGFIPANIVWKNYQCGKTLYWRLVDYSNPLIIKSATHADVISCTNSLKLYYLDWTSLYFDSNTKKQKVYSAQWDGNNNGVMDEEDYWWQVFRGQVSTYR